MEVTKLNEKIVALKAMIETVDETTKARLLKQLAGMQLGLEKLKVRESTPGNVNVQGFNDLDRKHANDQVKCWVNDGYKHDSNTNALIPFHFPERFVSQENTVLSGVNNETKSVSLDSVYESSKENYTKYFYSLLQSC
jgi:hypothetical protein